MLKSLSNFLAAVLLIGSAKLIEVTLYEKPAYYDKQKEYKTEAKEKNSPKVKTSEPQVAKSDPDSVNQNSSEQNPASENPQSEPSGTPVTEEDTQPDNSGLTGEAYFADLKNSYLNPILAGLPEGRSREDVVVRYYRHGKDEDRVNALRSLGYYLHEREAEDSKEYASNVLYYGSDVDVRDIQIVAYTLLQNGVSLKAIQPSQYDWKYHSLEIGADSLLENKPTLKIADIEAFSR